MLWIIKDGGLQDGVMQGAVIQAAVVREDYEAAALCWNDAMRGVVLCMGVMRRLL